MSNITTFAIEEQIAKQKQQLIVLEAELVKAQQQAPDKQLAIELHSMLCNSNHTDDCGWHYEYNKGEHNWDQYTHARYLTKSHALIEKCNTLGLKVEHAITLYRLVKGI
jgi:hypothetical protein